VLCNPGFALRFQSALVNSSTRSSSEPRSQKGRGFLRSRPAARQQYRQRIRKRKPGAGGTVGAPTGSKRRTMPSKRPRLPQEVSRGAMAVNQRQPPQPPPTDMGG
jgi:hypothetical protein